MARKKSASAERVDRIIEFIECLTCPTGRGAGKPFKLLPFQKKFIRKVYGPQKKNIRTVERAILSIARKNGKTSFMACLALVHLVGPEAVVNGEIYTAANDKEQAGIVFKICMQIINATPALKSELRIIESRKRIVHYASGSYYQALSADVGTKHGLNPTLIIYDELSQVKKWDLYNALDTSMGARDEALFVIISTQSEDPDHLLSQLIDDGLKGVDKSIVVHLYETDEDADIWDEKSWKASNPALGKYRRIEDVRKVANKAKRVPSLENPFRNLYLNQRVRSESPFIPRPIWLECQAREEEEKLRKGEKIILALDLSATTDLCALVAVSVEDGDRTGAWFWKPEALLEDHEKRDRVPYGVWVDQGHIEATPGRSVAYRFILQRIMEIDKEYEIGAIAYDRWRIEILLERMDEEGIDAWIEGEDDELSGGLRLVPFGQGYKDMGPAVDAIETTILNQTFRHPMNPVLTWNFSNAIIVSDPAGNRKLDKSKSRYRIDGAVAATMAIGLKTRERGKEPEPSVYETRGLVVV